MGALRWVLLDQTGQELRATEEFATQEAAERWLAGNWQDLADEGAAAVSLRAGDDEVYEMSLAEV